MIVKAVLEYLSNFIDLNKLPFSVTNVCIIETASNKVVICLSRPYYYKSTKNLDKTPFDYNDPELLSKLEKALTNYVFD